MAASYKTVIEFLTSPDWTEGEKFIIQWQFEMLTSDFQLALIKTITRADGDNLARLELGFPIEVAAFRSWSHGNLGERLRKAGLGV